MIHDRAKVIPRTKIVNEDDKWHIGDFCLVVVPRLEMGSHSQINAGTKVLGRETVKIGQRSVISYDCLLLTSTDHPNPKEWKHDDYSPENERRIQTASITIGNDCFVGAKSVLMPGVTLPDKQVVPAGSYVYMKGGVCYARPLGDINTWSDKS